MPVKRILLTRAPHQNSELAESLRVAGMEPILIPSIEIVEPTSFAALDAALGRLNTFHWLLFTSANAVEAFVSRATHLSDGFIAKMGEAAPRLKVAAIGPATARAVEAAGLRVDLIPPLAVAESLAASLLPHALQRDGIPTRFLLVRAELARDHLPSALRSAGAEVTVAPAYRTIIPRGSIPAIRDLFSDPEDYPDAIAFTSSSTVHNLLALLEAAGFTLPPEILRASIGPITSQTLTQLGFSPDIEAGHPGVPALVQEIIAKLDLK